MRYLPLLIFLTLTACWSTDPAVLREQAASIERQSARATSQARAQQAEKDAQAEAATAEAQAADRAEIERIQAAGQGTATAIMAREQALDLAQREAQATREASEYALAAQSTRTAYDATQAALVLAMVYEPTRQAQNQLRNDIINRGLSLSLIVLMVLLVVLAVILITWVRNWLGWKIEWSNRKNSLFHTPDGTVKVDGAGDIVLVRDDNYLRRTVRESRTQTTDVTYISPSVIASEPASHDDQLKDGALRLLEWVKDDGHIPGHRDINWSSGAWQKAIGYFRALNLVEKSGDGWELRASAQQVRYQLTSPTNGGSQKN